MYKQVQMNIRILVVRKVTKSLSQKKIASDLHISRCSIQTISKTFTEYYTRSKTSIESVAIR